MLDWKEYRDSKGKWRCVHAIKVNLYWYCLQQSKRKIKQNQTHSNLTTRLNYCITDANNGPTTSLKHSRSIIYVYSINHLKSINKCNLSLLLSLVRIHFYVVCVSDVSFFIYDYFNTCFFELYNEYDLTKLEWREGGKVVLNVANTMKLTKNNNQIIKKYNQFQ